MENTIPDTYEAFSATMDERTQHYSAKEIGEIALEFYSYDSVALRDFGPTSRGEREAPTHHVVQVTIAAFGRESVWSFRQAFAMGGETEAGHQVRGDGIKKTLESFFARWKKERVE